MKRSMVFAVTMALVMCTLVGEGWAKKSTVSQVLKGPISFRLRTVSAEVTIVVGTKGKATMTVHGEVEKITLALDGNVLRAKFEHKKKTSGHGSIDHIRVALPVGTNVEISSVSGDVALGALAGNVLLKTVSGDVSVAASKNLEVKTVSGDVAAKNVNGAVRIKTVSGDVAAQTTGKLSKGIEFSSTSGDLSWSGVCAKGCRINVRSLSGDSSLTLGPASATRILFKSFSGEVNDKLGVSGNQGSGFGSKNFDAVYKRADGLIDVSTHSGDLTLRKK